MDHYVDITNEAFQALQNHETDCLVLTEDIAASFQAGDTLKLYHPSDKNEALRVLIEGVKIEDVKREENSAEIILQCSLLEWVFQIETELDDLLKEEQAMIDSLF